MAVLFSETKSRVNELGDGRIFSEEKQASWANSIRKDVAMNYEIGGIYGIYFLFKEAIVKNGSKKDEPRYAIPTDYIDHLNVFYAGKLLTDSPPKTINIVQDLTQVGTPEWVRILGVEFDIRPIPDTTGEEIKLLFNGLPSEIPSSSNNNFADYFLNHFPGLHIWGMAEWMALSIGATKLAQSYGSKYIREQKKLQLHNRRHWFKNARIRYQNWDEYEDQKRTLFPQFTVT